jgi:hypothetical protein
MTPLEIFEKHGAVHVKEVIPKELYNFLSYVLLRKASYPNSQGDEQIPNAKAILDHEYMFETLLEFLWPKIELVLGVELLPTYAYARLYSNGDELKIHTDRSACDVSVTLQLGRSHHYAWPIYMGGKRYDLAEGDGVIYRGCDIEHWRNVCDGPEEYYSGQVFLHYVRKDGPHASHACDSINRQPWPNMFVKHRAFVMENK